MKTSQKIVLNNDGSFYMEDPSEYNFEVLGVERITKSGNPNFDPATGQFASGSDEEKKQKALGKKIKLSEYNPLVMQAFKRRKDAIRTIARTGRIITPELVIKKTEDLRSRDLTQQEITRLIEDARNQQMDDIVDILDGQIKGQGLRAKSQDPVIVKATKGWVKAILRSMTLDEVYDAYRRLLARGVSEDDMAKKFFNRLSPERQKDIVNKLGTSNPATQEVYENKSVKE